MVWRILSLTDSVHVLCHRFSCAGCSARYVGETSRHFAARVREHLSTNGASYIHKHLQASGSCRNLCTKNNFKILDSASSSYQLNTGIFTAVIVYCKVVINLIVLRLYKRSCNLFPPVTDDEHGGVVLQY